MTETKLSQADIDFQAPRISQETKESKFESLIDYPEGLNPRERQLYRVRRLKEIAYLALMEPDNNPESIKIQAQLPEIQDTILQESIYLTDTPGIVLSEKMTPEEQILEGRREISGEDLVSACDYLTRRLEDYTGDPLILIRLDKILAAYSNFCLSKTFYTRENFHGLSDFISDSLISEQILEQVTVDYFLQLPEVQAQLGVFIQEAHSKADQESLDLPELLGQHLDTLPKKDRDKLMKLYQKTEIETIRDIIRLQHAASDLAGNYELATLKDKKIDQLPLELQALLAENPDLISDLSILQASQEEIHFQTCLQTPMKVIEAVRRISRLSQYNYTTTWLNDFLISGKEPDLSITAVSKERISDENVKLAEQQEKIIKRILKQKRHLPHFNMISAFDDFETAIKADLSADLSEQNPKLIDQATWQRLNSEINRLVNTLEEFREDLLAKLRNNPQNAELSEEVFSLNCAIENILNQGEKAQRTSETLSEPINLQKDLETIRDSLGQYLTLDGLNKEKLSPEELAALERINQELSQIDHEYAVGRVQFDTSDEQSHEAKKIVQSLLYIGPSTHALEMCHLGVLAKLFASSTDDLIGEYAEIHALLGAGYHMKDIWRRLPLAVGVFGGATYGATQVERLIEEGRPETAGALFGLTAVALSLTTSLQSMKMYHDGYVSLAREGKIGANSFLAGSKEFKRLFRQFSRDLDQLETPEQIKAFLISLLDRIEDNTLSEETKEALRQEFAQMDIEQIQTLLNRNLHREAWVNGIKQDFNNPVRLGILTGSAMAPVAGATLGFGMPSLLNNGMVLAGIGSIESITANLIVQGARTLNNYRWKNHLYHRLNPGTNPPTKNR